MLTLDRLGPLLPVGLLIAVALTHLYRVDTLDLTPWKGGGFGMFSTLDGRDNRRLLVHLESPSESGTRRTVAELPRTRRVEWLAEQARAMPTAERLQHLADELATQPWRLRAGSNPDGVARARVLKDRIALHQSRPAAFDGIEVSVWKLEFSDSNATELVARSSLVRTVRAKRPVRSRGGS
jgi:hypothetical protein